MTRLLKVLLLSVLFVFASAVLLADVTTKGQIEGAVHANGDPLPGATVTLSGGSLQQGEIVETTDQDGRYRFLNLNPGAYRLRFELSGFTPRVYEDLQVRVGRTTTMDAALQLSPVSETVTVQADAPLFDQTSAAHGTNLTIEELESLPTSREFIDVVDTAAGFDNQSAYGAGGNVAGYDSFGYGAATNSYQFNGVNVTNLEFGNSWVLPNYDTIQEIQIVGPGGSAEYSNYSGAVVNVVTKAGGNQFFGTASAFYTDDSLTGDNSGGIKDLELGPLDYDSEFALTYGGPLIREKLHFFAGAARLMSAKAPPGTTFYDDQTRSQYQLRLDFLPTSRQMITGMINHDPITLEDLGLQEETGPEVGYSREQDTTTTFLSWTSQFSSNTVAELRYAGVEGEQGRIPNAPLDVPGVTDASTGIVYNSTGFQRIQENTRDELRAVATHYVSDFLNGSHEFKGGIDHEDAWQRTEFITSGGVLFYLVPIGGGLTYIQGLTGYNVNQQADLERTGAFIQDRATFGRATVSLGVRYDEPTTTDANTGVDMLSFEQIAPRLGLAYDIRGNGRSVVRLGAGRYFDKVPTYGPGTYAGTGLGEVTYYGVVTDQPIDPANTDALKEILLKPENITIVFNSTAIPVEDDIRGPHVDVFNVGYDQEIGKRWAVSLNYLHRKTEDFITLVQHANPEVWEPVEYTSDFTGETFTIWRVAGGGPRQEALGNRDFFYQETDMAIIELRGRPTTRLNVDASITLEQSRGTRDNNECGILGLCSNGVDNNPNFQENPFHTEGSLSQERPWHFKTRGSWQLPAGFQAGWDFRWFAGRRYGAVDYCFNIPVCNDPASFQVRLEPRDARKERDSTLLNLRLGYEFAFGPTSATLSLDALNVTNEPIDFNTNIQNNIGAVYGRESAEQGQLVSAFGQPYELTEPRQFRFGVRLQF